jgi:hypothetical protein
VTNDAKLGREQRRENANWCLLSFRGPSFETAASRPPQDEVVMRGKLSDPDGEERGGAARLEPRGPDGRLCENRIEGLGVPHLHCHRPRRRAIQYAALPRLKY